MKILSERFPLRWLFFTNLTPFRVFVEVIYRIEFLIKLEYISCFTPPSRRGRQKGRQAILLCHVPCSPLNGGLRTTTAATELSFT